MSFSVSASRRTATSAHRSCTSRSTGRRFAITSLVLLALACAPDDGRVTQREADRVRGGMSRAEVRDICGEPYAMHDSTWFYRAGTGDASVFAVRFAGGKVASYRTTIDRQGILK